jgi:hypothetical protein
MGKSPERGDTEVLDVIELLDQSAKVTDPVVVAVVEGLDVQLVDDGVLVPEGVIRPHKAAVDPGSRLGGRLGSQTHRHLVSEIIERGSVRTLSG